MKKLKLIFPFLKQLITKPSVITKALYHAVVTEDRKNYTQGKYGLENGLPEIDLLTLFADFSGEAECFTHLYGTSLPIDFVILKKFAVQFEQCSYLEIGTWRGESLANLSPICDSCVSVSLSDDEMRAFGC